MIDQFVFGLERPAISRASLPKTSVRGTFGSSDMVHSQMTDDIAHTRESLAAGFPRARWLIDPQTGVLLFARARPHVPEESSVRRCHVMVVLESVLSVSVGSRVRINTGMRLMVMVMMVSHQRIVQRMDIRKEYFASGSRSRTGGCEFVVVPTFEEISRVTGVMGVEMRCHRMSVAGRCRLMVVMMVAVMELRLLLLSQHLSVILRWRRTKFDTHARV